MFIDTHCHLNFEVFNNDWREAADRAVAAGVTKMIVVGADLVSSERAVELAQQHPALYASVGLHPHHARQILDDRLQMTEIITTLRTLAKKPRVVAIGEIGLDYHVPKESKYPAELLPITEELKMIQRELFIGQVKLAQELNKPMILHSRECGEEVLEILRLQMTDDGLPIKGVFHCFGGSKKYVKRIIEAGFYVGFDGDITYVPDRLNVAAEVPLDRLLLETDSPFLSPLPNRGKRNEPANITLVTQKQAEARGITVEEVAEATTKNAEILFGFMI